MDAHYFLCWNPGDHFQLANIVSNSYLPAWPQPWEEYPKRGLNSTWVPYLSTVYYAISLSLDYGVSGIEKGCRCILHISHYGHTSTIVIPQILWTLHHALIYTHFPEGVWLHVRGGAASNWRICRLLSDWGWPLLQYVWRFKSTLPAAQIHILLV